MKLMIVEDNGIMRSFLKDLLSDIAQEIFIEASGEDAVRQYRREKPDVVTMDITMPGIDGFVVTRQIRAIDPEAHVLIVTGYDNPDYRLAAELAGARRYFVKEDLSALLDYFRELCRTR